MIMSRKIIFRAKSKSTNTWLYGDLLRNEQGAFAVVPPFKMNMDNECNLYEVDKETVGQFTGLTDKNGKDIYQHDIIQLQGKENKYNCLVDWNINLGAWCISIENKCVGVKPLGEWLCEDKFEVIGTIYDSAYLLEE